jgi:hypothetical protein
VHSGGSIATDGDAVPVLDGVVFDQYVRASGFDHDIVVARVDVAVANPEIRAGASDGDVVKFVAVDS